MRKKGKVIACLLLSLSLLGGCSGSNNTSTASEASTSPEVQVSAESQETQENSVQAEGTLIFGQVTAIADNTITIALAEQPQMMEGGQAPGDMPAGGEGTMPSDVPAGGEGTMPSDMPARGEGTMPSDMPAGGEGMMPSDMPAGGNGGGMQHELTLTGESQDIMISDTTTIMLNGVSADISDISVGDVVTVEMSGNEVVSVSVGFGGGQAPAGNVNEGNANATN